MPTENSRKVKEFLKENVYFLDIDMSSGPIVDLPDYELHPREFLQFAEVELDDLKTRMSVVNCVSNLKRAIDCQIDIFLFALNLLDIYKKRNLGVDRKLGFIEKCGIFSKRSLSRINTIRNKLEHNYEIPKIDDIHVYFDLVFSFISILEIQMLIGGPYCESAFKILEYPDNEEEDPKIVGNLLSEYSPKSRCHTFSWEVNGVKERYEANENELSELAAFIHYHTLLLNISRTYHGQYANSQLERL